MALTAFARIALVPFFVEADLVPMMGMLLPSLGTINGQKDSAHVSIERAGGCDRKLKKLESTLSADSLAIAEGGPSQFRIRRGRVEQRLVEGVPVRRRQNDPFACLDHAFGRRHCVCRYESANHCFPLG